MNSPHSPADNNTASPTAAPAATSDVPGAIHEAIMRVVRPGREREFETLIEQFFEDAAKHPGVSGAYLIRPFPGSESRQYGILRSFASEADRDRFYRSDLYRRWNDTVRPLVEGEPRRQHLSGMEAFFRAPGSPPRWKMALITWLGVNAAVYVFSRLFAAAFDWLPVAATFLLVNACVVVALTWVLMPILTRIFGGWLKS
jgi:antibiotic biosynthesis monooxygenase (ABM) superfamily enzyme